MDLVLGIDVAQYEPRVDWRALRAQNVRFALVRATSGSGFVDPKFVNHWAGARAEGILRGAYHYLFAEEDAKRQAQLFISTVGADKGELPPIVDLEDAYNEKASNAKIISTCKAVIDIVEQAFGRKPMVYSRKTYLDAHFTQSGKAPAWAKDYELWVAQYPFKFDPTVMPNKNMPMQPPGWKPWRIWQFSETAILEGVMDENNMPTRIDLNWFRGTEAELYQYAQVEPVKPESYTVKTGDTFKSIADAHQLTITELLDANPSLLKVGAKLSIPGRIIIPDPTPDPVQPDPVKPVITHKVTKTDTLSGIAFKYKTTVDAILAVNPQITNRNIIFEGQIIIIPGK
jgi:GH25 family lysozyme M1 (1,4-beta-N-acetylmuramidase)/phage tail protein X